MMPRPPMRKGTSKIVPVVVSAGLAVGVFCGLLFGVGTGKHSEAAPDKASNNARRADDSFTPESMANPNVKIPDKNAPKAGSNAAVATAGSGDAAGSNAAAAPAIKPTKLIVDILPQTAAQNAKVLVDGKPIEGMSVDIPLDPGTTKKTVKVQVKASSYRDIEQEVDVEGESVTVHVELSKGRSTPTSNAAGPGASPAGSGDGNATAASGGTGGGSHSGAAATGGGNTGGGNTGGGSKSTGGSKTNSNTGKTGKTGKGSGGLIDI
jgi:hypothetical protein